MAMNASAMKDKIISALNGDANGAVSANKKFGDAVLKYIVDNMDITYSWSATNPSSGAVDPVTSFKASISGSGTLVPSGSLALFLIALATLIKSSLTISPATGFTVSPLAFNPAGTINVTMAKETTQDTALTNFCSQLIASLKSSFPNSAPAAGSHAAFTGATTGMVIA